jgi:hypothetical protein
MFIEVIHAESGKKFIIPVTQVVTTTETGDPIAVAFTSAGMVVHSDATQSDFSAVCKSIGVRKLNLGK